MRGLQLALPLPEPTPLPTDAAPGDDMGRPRRLQQIEKMIAEAHAEGIGWTYPG